MILYKGCVPMSVKYIRIVKHPKIFLRLFGVNSSDFDAIFKSAAPLWEKQILGKYKCLGRHFALSLEDMILMLPLYYRTYTNQMFVGYLFGLDDFRACRIIQKLESVLARVMNIPNKNICFRRMLRAALSMLMNNPLNDLKKARNITILEKRNRVLFMFSTSNAGN